MADGPTVMGDQHSNWARFIGRVLIVTVVVIFLAALWFATRVFLLAFLGILFGLLLHTLANWVARHSPLSYGWSLALVIVLLLIVIGGGGWLIGEQLTGQLSQLSERLPQSWQEIEKQLDNTQWGRWIEKKLPSSPLALGRQDLFSQVTGALSSLTGFAVELVVVLFVGVYLAASPQWYQDGVVGLAPLDYRDRVRSALRNTAAVLRWWLLAQLITMLIVGLATGLGLWLVGVPLALSLGLLAFFFEIIPNLGPILAAIPAFLIAWTHGSTTLLLAVLVYAIVQALEAYVVLPLLQQRAVRLPPALSILMVVLFGLVGGTLGVLVAAPATVAGIVLIKMLYVKDVLGDRNVSLPLDA